MDQEQDRERELLLNVRQAAQDLIRHYGPRQLPPILEEKICTLQRALRVHSEYVIWEIDQILEGEQPT